MSNKPTKPGKKPGTSTWKLIRNRVVTGFFVVLPIFITFIVIKWLYDILSDVLITPISRWLLSSWYPEGQTSFFVENIAAPFAAIVLVAALLFIAGMFFNSRLLQLVNWIINTVPGVNTVHSVVSNVINAIQRSQFGAEQFKRVVLVQFPHPGMKVPAFVTSETEDRSTGDTILCVYVPTTPVPTSGYMLMVPEAEVVPLDWDLQETLQAIVSGGITAPTKVHYYAPEKLPTIENQKD